MDAAMRETSQYEADLPLAGYASEARDAVVAAVRAAVKPIDSRIVHAVDEAVVEARRLPPRFPSMGAQRDGRCINTTTVGESFYRTAAKDGISVIELCGGIGAGLEAVLRAGIRVNKYKYVDIDHMARKVIAHKLVNLSARYPDLLPISAWRDAFDLPQDLNRVEAFHLRNSIGHDTQEQWLLTAGWPCQDYSAAGRGRLGERASLLERVVFVLNWLETVCVGKPPAYVWKT